LKVVAVRLPNAGLGAGVGMPPVEAAVGLGDFRADGGVLRLRSEVPAGYGVSSRCRDRGLLVVEGGAAANRADFFASIIAAAADCGVLHLERSWPDILVNSKGM
jgi:hypothetical protein